MTELKDTSVGLKNAIRVGFIFSDFDNWTGGINYFKNLFEACSKVNNPKILPCILEPANEREKILLQNAQIINHQQIKSRLYYFKKFISLFRKKKFNKNKYIKYIYNDIDVVSHSQILEEYPAISWIPDFQHLHLPEFFSEEENNWRNDGFMQKAQLSEIVVLSSYDALDDFKKFAPQYAHKGRVLHFVAIPDKNVYEDTDRQKDRIIEKLNLNEKYFYLPNQFWVHKNHKVVFEAVSILKKQDIDVKIVLSGNTKDYRNKDYFQNLMNFVKENNIEQNIQILGLIDMIDVYYLMRNCVSIINPSLFEGWSSTVEEAKSLGKNIILSNLNVHKEQNPPEGIYFDPHNAYELAQILKNKWQNSNGGPDYKLEQAAKENLQDRIFDFAKTYQSIVKEALKLE